MDQAGLQALCTYNRYANKLLLDEIEKLSADVFVQEATSPSHGSVRALLQHMLAVEAFFLNQCQGGPFEFDRQTLDTLEAIRRRWTALEKEQHNFIASMTEAETIRLIQVPMRGQELELTVWELLVQAFTSSIHHRGELSIVLTQLGHPLPTLDAIIYFVEQSGQQWPHG